ncbi:calcium-binding protein 39 [Klebsormidium nitens]|uniref:Calcium-binding protein 39 n=1 Tax=Klebsormidium nitens TaxID=105231 RepID=A0A1Y1HQD0_KLENI|nr:calcium-binding protein 39 [Klebsormidium nitens]|eukprot:GAQ78796.1 calcium-binding protein 39 [Klebsormidium nitens]
MSFSLFKQKGVRTPEDIVRHVRDALRASVEHHDQSSEAETKLRYEKACESLEVLKAALGSDSSVEGAPDAVAEAACREAVPEALIAALPGLDFQGRKLAAAVFAGLLRQPAPPVYLEQHPLLMDQLIAGYAQPPIALFCGSMLRDCARHAGVTREVLSLPSFFRFFEYAQAPSFEVSCDAFTTFKELLTRHPDVTTPFLVAHYTQFFEQYRGLLTSDNYVTKRQSLKFLGELLLARAHVAVLVRYIADVHNLRLLMLLLKDPSKSIQFEAFHVFKVFVAAPHKEPPVLALLCKNKARLLTYLHDFQNDKEDEQFEEEKALLVKEVQQLPEPGPKITNERNAAVD